MKRELIPTDQVLSWLHANHPELIPHVELDRSWVWLANVDLRKQPDVRQSLKDYGFIFARRGHPLESGRSGTWGHSCDTPIPFARRDKSRTRTNNHQRKEPAPPPPRAGGSGRFDPLAQPSAPQVPAVQAAGAFDDPPPEVDAELLAWINS